jgi:photosystem II stability/assembly factor-like uncharacterized protein
MTYSMKSTRRSVLLSLIISLTLSISATGVQQKRTTSKKRPRYKAIFEPVSYKGDLQFTDVFFVTDKVGWLSGSVGYRKGGVILHTKDGGDTWSIQLGDVQSSEQTYGQLRFLDEKHGFAVQPASPGDHKLLRTTDGETWEVSGTVPQHRGDYAFTSPTVGFTSTGNQILRTVDAGRTWKEVFACETTVEVEGLIRKAGCHFNSLHFPTRDVGYAIGESPQVKEVFVAKTEDGGSSWKVWTVLPGGSSHEGDVFFTDEETGFVRLWDGKFFGTTDGGQTWRGMAGTDGSGKPEIKFADRHVGWSVAPYGPFNYTVDGGKRWAVREIKFPTRVNAFSLPRRDRGYVVGDHGMIYRYRVVPVDYTTSGMIEAPMMPAAGSADLIPDFVAPNARQPDRAATRMTTGPRSSESRSLRKLPGLAR